MRWAVAGASSTARHASQGTSARPTVRTVPCSAVRPLSDAGTEAAPVLRPAASVCRSRPGNAASQPVLPIPHAADRHVPGDVEALTTAKQPRDAVCPRQASRSLTIGSLVSSPIPSLFLFLCVALGGYINFL